VDIGLDHRRVQPKPPAADNLLLARNRYDTLVESGDDLRTKAPRLNRRFETHHFCAGK
jgi:hypothetical protein